MSFFDRSEAGHRLAEALRPIDGSDVVVIGLARGGVAVAAEVARDLRRPLDAMIVRKIRAPFAPELAMGAVGEDGIEIIDRGIVSSAAVSDEELDAASVRARREAVRALASIREERPLIDVTDRVVFLVDDGIATGSTAKVACQMLRHRHARRIVLATPVAPREATEEFHGLADELVVLETPDPFYAVGSHYERFPQLSDDDVVEFLRRADRALWKEPVVTAGLACIDEHIDIAVSTSSGSAALAADLRIPPVPAGAIVFVHGSGSSRHSARNLHIADALNAAGFATLLFDLTTRAEFEGDGQGVDLHDAARRTSAIVHWLHDRVGADVPIGIIGSSTGAAVALEVAADRACDVRAVVSRGGRVDLVDGVTTSLDVPVLLIVGGDDVDVLEMNRRFASRVRAPNELSVVDGATHLFSEPGALEQATDLAVAWFERWFVRAGAPIGSPGS